MALPASPSPATVSTPFIPGAGYGVGIAAGAAGPGLLAGYQYADAQALRERQMDVTEGAQRATAGYYGAIEADMANREQRIQDSAATAVTAHGILNPATESAPTKTASPAPAGEQPYPVPASTIPTNLPLPQGATPDVPGVVRTAPDAYGVEVKKSMTAEPKGPPPVANQGFSIRPHTVREPGGGPGTGPLPGNAAIAADSGSAGRLTPDQLTKTATGNMAVTPTEGSGFLDTAAKLRDQAKGVQSRLEDALKMIDKQYSGDPTHAAYLKANLIASVDPQVAAMNANAAQLETHGMIANHMQDGASLGGRIMARLNSGMTLDDEFINDPTNAKLIKSLGANVGELAGMHLSNGSHKGDDQYNKGFIVNGGGFIIPPKALAAASNFALPWQERYEKWNDITGMYKDQMAAKAEMTRAYNTNPHDIVDYAAKKTQETVEKVSNLTRVRDNAFNVLATGGTLSVPGPDGKPTRLTLPPMPAPPTGALDPQKVMADYVSRTFKGDPTLSPDIKAAVHVYLDAQQGVDTFTTVLPVYSRFGAKSVNAPENTNTTRFKEDQKEENREALAEEKARLSK
jgi:hypothetical protein